MQPGVVEIVTFKLKSGADEAEFLVSNQSVEAFCSKQPGFVARRLTRDENGEWLDYVEWVDMDAATKAAEVMPNAEGVGPFLAAIEMPTVKMRHLTVMLQH